MPFSPKITQEIKQNSQKFEVFSFFEFSDVLKEIDVCFDPFSTFCYVTIHPGFFIHTIVSIQNLGFAFKMIYFATKKPHVQSVTRFA